MTAAMLINSHTTADGQLQHCLAVPQMVMATSLMELQSDTCSVESIHDGGVLLGAHHFQTVLTLPLADSLTGTIPVRHVATYSLSMSSSIQGAVQLERTLLPPVLLSTDFALHCLLNLNHRIQVLIGCSLPVPINTPVCLH